jgi:hypothetical protein
MWTYDINNLNKLTAEGRKNLVRLLVGDTDTNDQQLQDEEINVFLSENNDNHASAAYDVAMSIWAKYARLVNTELDESIRADYSDLADNYKNLAISLRQRADEKKVKINLFATGLVASDLPPKV